MNESIDQGGVERAHARLENYFRPLVQRIIDGKGNGYATLREADSKQLTLEELDTWDAFIVLMRQLQALLEEYQRHGKRWAGTAQTVDGLKKLHTAEQEAFAISQVRFKSLLDTRARNAFYDWLNTVRAVLRSNVEFCLETLQASGTVPARDLEDILNDVGTILNLAK